MKRLDNDELHVKTKEDFLKIKDNLVGKSFHDHIYILPLLRSTFPEEQSINFLEIGCFCGHSASAVLNARGETNLYLVDTFCPHTAHAFGLADLDELTRKNYDIVKKNKEHESSLTLFMGYSSEEKIITQVEESLLEAGVDILHIDGDHGAGAAELDFNNYSELVNSGGYVVFDDYADLRHSPEVRPSVDRLVKLEKTQKDFDIIGQLSHPNFKSDYHTDSLGNSYIFRKK